MQNYIKKFQCAMISATFFAKLLNTKYYVVKAKLHLPPEC